MGNILFFASCLPLAAKKYFYALQINKTFVIFRRTLGSGRIKISSWQIHICKICVQFYRRARLNASNLRPFLGPERKLVSRWTCNQDVLQPLLFQGAWMELFLLSPPPVARGLGSWYFSSGFIRHPHLGRTRRMSNPHDVRRTRCLLFYIYFLLFFLGIQQTQLPQQVCAG